MRSTTLSVVLAATALSACAHGTQLSAAGCEQTAAKGVTSFTQSATRDVNNKFGTLTAQVFEGTKRHPALGEASVTLHGDTNVIILSAPLRSAQTDTRGEVHWDSIPAGRYLLAVRRAGYEGLRRVLSLRAGFADTVVVLLRTEPHC